jgi:hypothetical protein
MLEERYVIPHPITVNVFSDEYIVSDDGKKVVGACFCPHNAIEDAYIRIATGDFVALADQTGEANALYNILRVLPHELTHFLAWSHFPFLERARVFDFVLEKQAERYSDKLTAEYMNSTRVSFRHSIMERIKDFCGESLLALYYDECDSDRFCVGKIAMENERELLLSVFGSDGQSDGVSCFAKNAIFRLEFGSQYLSAMKLKLVEVGYENIIADISEEEIQGSLLSLLMRDGTVASFETANGGNDIYGVVQSFDESNGIVTIEQYTELGEPDGISFLAAKAISVIGMCGAEEEQIASARAGMTG